MLDVGIMSCSQISLLFNGVEKKTCKVRGSQDPLWRETFKFQLNDEEARKSLLFKARKTFLKCCVASELAVDLDGLDKLARALGIRETAKSLMDKYDMSRTGLIDWGSFIVMFDGMGLDRRDLVVTLYDSAIGGLPQSVGSARISAKGFKSGALSAPRLQAW